MELHNINKKLISDKALHRQNNKISSKQSNLFDAMMEKMQEAEFSAPLIAPKFDLAI